MTVMSQATIFFIMQRKAELQLRQIILQGRHDRLLNARMQYENQISMSQQYMASFNTNASLVQNWMAANPELAAQYNIVDANSDNCPVYIPGYEDLPDGYDSQVEILALENGAELELQAMNEIEKHLELEIARNETELAALETKQKSIEKMHNNSIKQQFGTFGDS